MWGRGVHVSEYIRSREEMLALLISGWGNSRYFLLLYTCLHFLFSFSFWLWAYITFFSYILSENFRRPFFHNYRKAQMWSWLETKDAVMNPTAVLIWGSQNTSQNICWGLGRPWRYLGQSRPAWESPGGQSQIPVLPQSRLIDVPEVLHHLEQVSKVPEDPGSHSQPLPLLFRALGSSWSACFTTLPCHSCLKPTTHHSPEERWSHRGHTGLLGPGKAGSPHPGHLEDLIKGATGEAWLRDPENGVHPRAGYLPRVGYELCNLTGGLFLQFLCL